MSILTVKNMSHSFGDRVIFSNTSFRLLKNEHIGLIGANGEGKSTFMNIITDKLIPDEGIIEWSSQVSVGYMDQHIQLSKDKTIRSVLREAFQYLYDLEEEMNELYNRISEMNDIQLERVLRQTARIQDTLDTNEFYSIDSKIEAIAGGLGLRDIGLDKTVTELSGGQRTKVLLAKLLLEKPNILLLDEPTNYLDEDHIQWLTVFLRNYDHAFILISHDMHFLNDVVNVIYHIENNILTRYNGNYESFLRNYEENRKQLQIAYINQQKEITKLEDYIRKNKVRASTAKMAKSRQKKLDKIERIEISKKAPKPFFNFKMARASERLIFETMNLMIGYEYPLTKPLNLKMERGEKIALIGANGIGKTTLLKSLMGLIQPLQGDVELGNYQKIGYFEQEVKSVNTHTVLDEVWYELEGLKKHVVRSALAKCGLTSEHIDSSICMLSGGEQTKVRLCKLINQPTNILILDEPTNHLDTDAKDELKRALSEYEGSILLVCHEPEFYMDIVTNVWNCEEWK
ncbi:ABC-F family ATP-binding cassette domain-containing protein [Vallitalea okinawensis]|uniref:ABC-F family ATP-binding cassette domain-containing protein n=1 Tax=Vallitalea okinawensis TaxID=2078660 RepID=UPI000CFC6E35|nr:ABC-F family ATP-binding cassette domain-containing protein [Vallitalea okinawensis]